LFWHKTLWTLRPYEVNDPLRSSSAHPARQAQPEWAVVASSVVPLLWRPVLLRHLIIFLQYPRWGCHSSLRRSLHIRSMGHAVLRLQSIFGKVLLSKQDQHEVQDTSCWESEGIRQLPIRNPKCEVRRGCSGMPKGFESVHTLRAGFASPVPPIGACRGAEPLCVFLYPPRLGGEGG